MPLDRRKVRWTESTLPISVRNLSLVVNDNPIVKNINLLIENDGCTVIMGYNGAGKSTLLRLLSGLVKPTSGEIKWGTTKSVQPDSFSVVLQHPVMLRRSVHENIDYAMKVQGIRRSLRTHRLKKLLQLCDLTHLTERQATIISGGEQQRLALARAMSTDPEVLFLDEPTASLDPSSTRSIEDLISQNVKNARKILMVTQNVAQAERLANAVIFVHKGQIMEHTTSSQFFSHPKSPVAHAFLQGKLEP